MCAVGETSTKNKVTSDTKSINMWILAGESCCFANFSNIKSWWCHNDFISGKYDLRLEYQILFGCWISAHDLEYRPIYCNVAQKMRNFSAICLNKSNNKNRTRRGFSILFSVIESLEIALQKWKELCLKVSENIDQLHESTLFSYSFIQMSLMTSSL